MTLSDKRLELEHDTNDVRFLIGDDFIRVKDVKEFIKELKEDLCSTGTIGDIIIERAIDKFAGEDLI